MLIFVSYARKDKELVDELLVHLRPLSRQGVRVWLDAEIEGGEAWEQRIRARLAEADLVVACVSPRFVDSEWCLAEAAFAREAGTAILPVPLSKFARVHDPFGDLQYKPGLERPVSTWGDREARDGAWAEVVEEVHLLLERIREGREAAERAKAAEVARAAVAVAPAVRERAAACATGSTAQPAVAWAGPNGHLVPPLITLVPGTGVDGKPGTFWMGSPPGVGDNQEHPQRLVTLTRAYAVGESPVTQAQWRAVVEAAKAATWAKAEPGVAELNPAPSHFSEGPDAERRPVERVSWFDAVVWCNVLSRLAGRAPAYRLKGDTWLRAADSAGFRLPTEAEWEHACRAHAPTRWCFGDDESRLGKHCWFDGNANGSTHPVKSKVPNMWGLYDVHGNVWEWCEDGWSKSYDANATTDPVVPFGGARVFRGGCFWDSADGCRSAFRDGRHPDLRNLDQGLRVALSPPPGEAGV